MTIYSMPDTPEARVYAAAIKREFAQQLGIDPALVDVTWGDDDDTVRVTVPGNEYIFEIGSDDDDNMCFIGRDANRVVVTLSEEDCKELDRLHRHLMDR